MSIVRAFRTDPVYAALVTELGRDGVAAPGETEDPAPGRWTESPIFDQLLTELPDPLAGAEW